MDSELISGEFLVEGKVATVPKPKEYLLKYFKNPLQLQFLVYYLSFYDLRKYSFAHFYQGFIDHTGFYCADRVVRYMISEINKLESMSKEAHDAIDLESLEKINKGKHRFKRRRNRP